MNRLQCTIILLVAAVAAILSCNDSNTQAVDEITNADTDTTDVDEITNADTDITDVDVGTPIDDDESNDSSGSDTEDTDVASDEDSYNLCDTVEVVPEGSESCPNPPVEKMYIRSIASGAPYFDSKLMKTKEGLPFIIDSVEVFERPGGIAPDDSGIRISGKCIGETGPHGEDRCAVSFGGYNLDLFDKHALLGRKWILYERNGFYGSIHGEWCGRDLYVAKTEDGSLVAVFGQDIVDEEGEHDFDVKVWPSDLLPGITAEPFVPQGCAICECRGFRDIPDNGDEESYRWDVLIAPPIKFVRDGKEIIVRNGDVITEDGYIYNVKRSWMVHEKDPDQILNTGGKPYSFDFTIVNKDVLK